VKIRGFRVELGEIQAALARHPAVRECVVTAREEDGDRQLVAYVVPGRGGNLHAGELRAGLKKRLPEYMVPSVFVVLEALPLTPNGKVDRSALPAPEPEARNEGASPRTPVECALAGIWCELLGLDKVFVGDDFFGLGGHSLLATRVASRLREAFGVEVPLRALFESPTLESLADQIETARWLSASHTAARTGGDREAGEL
jgi:acyl carrier protein